MSRAQESLPAGLVLLPMTWAWVHPLCGLSGWQEAQSSEEEMLGVVESPRQISVPE